MSCQACHDERERRLEAVFALRAVPALVVFALLAAQLVLLAAV